MRRRIQSNCCHYHKNFEEIPTKIYSRLQKIGKLIVFKLLRNAYASDKWKGANRKGLRLRKWHVVMLLVWLSIADYFAVSESIFYKQQVTTESIFNLNLSIHRQFSLSIEINKKIVVDNQTKEGHAVSI